MAPAKLLPVLVRLANTKGKTKTAPALPSTSSPLVIKLRRKYASSCKPSELFTRTRWHQKKGRDNLAPSTHHVSPVADEVHSPFISLTTSQVPSCPVPCSLPSLACHQRTTPSPPPIPSTSPPPSFLLPLRVFFLRRTSKVSSEQVSTNKHKNTRGRIPPLPVDWPGEPHSQSRPQRFVNDAFKQMRGNLNQKQAAMCSRISSRR